MLRPAFLPVVMMFSSSTSWASEKAEAIDVPPDPVNSALDARDWERACEILQRDWVEPPEPRAAARRALCLFHLGEFTTSARLASFALEEAAPHELSSYREKLTVLFEQAKSKVGTIQLIVETEGASVRLDGELQDGGRFFVSAGEHEIEVRSSGFETEQRTLSVEAGETVHASVKLRSSPRLEPQKEDAKTGKSRTPLLIGGVGGLLGAVAGTSTLIIAANANGRAQELRRGILADGASCNATVQHPDCDLLARKDKTSRTFGTASAISYGVGLAGVVVGTVWYFVQPAFPETRQVSLRALPVLGGSGIAWSGRF